LKKLKNFALGKKTKKQKRQKKSEQNSADERTSGITKIFDTPFAPVSTLYSKVAKTFLRNNDKP
jgi:hypothetical protein